MAPANISDLQGIFGKVVGAALALSGIVLFIMLIMGGVKFITSGGDAKAAEIAQKTITSAVGGLILILLSYLILVLFHNVTGVNVTNFAVYQP